MATYGSFRVSDKKCSTCSFYQGARQIALQANKPYYIHADSGHTVCMVNPNRKVTAAERCLAWKKWEKLV